MVFNDLDSIFKVTVELKIKLTCVHQNDYRGFLVYTKMTILVSVVGDIPGDISVGFVPIPIRFIMNNA